MKAFELIYDEPFWGEDGELDTFETHSHLKGTKEEVLELFKAFVENGSAVEGTLKMKEVNPEDYADSWAFFPASEYPWYK